MSEIIRRDFLKMIATGGAVLSVGGSISSTSLAEDKSKELKLLPKTRLTPLPGGYMGKILRVNLTEGRISEENLPEEGTLRKWLGGQGLGLALLMEELPLGVSPLSPENPLIFMTGPLTGTGLTPAGTKYIVLTLSPITGFTLGRAAASGYWGSYLKFSGYDGIIVTGAAKEPVYLWIYEGKVEIRSAKSLWGKDIHETVGLIKQEAGKPEAGVLAIGPAGENLVRGAMIMNDYNHAASHGVGAVMGSKKLKAIAVYGTKGVPLKDREKVLQAGNRWRQKITPYKYPESRYGPGYASIMKTIVNKNWQTTIFPDANKDFDKQEFTPRPCFGCIRSCPYDAKIGTGKHTGYVARLNPGGEAMEGAGFALGIGGSDVRYLNDVLNKLGIEAGIWGCAAGVAFEAYEKGLLTKDDADGLELRWGDSDAVEKLMWKVAHRDGWLADILAEGPKVTAEMIGGDAPKFAAHVRGGSPAMHDWRPYTANMLSELVNGGSQKPQCSGFDIGTGPGAPDLGYPLKTNPRTQKGKAKEVFISGNNRLFCGASGVCWFGQPMEKEGILQDMVDVLIGTTGWTNFSVEEALIVGERVWQLQHIFDLRHGWTPEDCYKNIGSRFLEPVPDGPFKGFTIAKFLPGLIYDFFRICGWDERTGKPYLDKLKRLDMKEYYELINHY